MNVGSSEKPIIVEDCG